MYAADGRRAEDRGQQAVHCAMQGPTDNARVGRTQCGSPGPRWCGRGSHSLATERFSDCPGHSTIEPVTTGQGAARRTGATHCRQPVSGGSLRLLIACSGGAPYAESLRGRSRPAPCGPGSSGECSRPAPCGPGYRSRALADSAPFDHATHDAPFRRYCVCFLGARAPRNAGRVLGPARAPLSAGRDTRALSPRGGCWQS